jgi:hypothetical protein
MANISDVHHMLDVMSEEFECAAKDVGVQERSEVADVRVVVDGRPAGVESERRGR